MKSAVVVAFTESRHSGEDINAEKAGRSIRMVTPTAARRGSVTQMRSKIEAIELLEKWARYRLGRIDGGIGWPRAVLLGKLRDGMPGTDCGRCKDAVTGASVGYIYLEAEGIARQKVTCPVCYGARKVKLDPNPNKVNPACIRGSGPSPGFSDDPTSERIDWLVCTELTEDQRLIVIAEFTWTGNRNQKISRLRIRHSTFNELLDDAIRVISENL